MRIFIKTILFIFLILIAAFVGTRINQKIIHNNQIASTLEAAEESYEQFRKTFDPSKKTIVVIGRSSATYSFQDGRENYDRYSFVDRLKLNFNVFNLVSLNLINFEQVHALLDFANSKEGHPDIFIIENPVYLTNEEYIEGENDFLLWVSCMGESRHSEACRSFSPFRKQKEKIALSIRPCEKKYQEELQLSYLKPSSDRKKVIKKIMNCGKSFNSQDEAKSLVTESFAHGFAQDLVVAEAPEFAPRGEIKNRDKKFRKRKRPQIVSYVDLLFIDKYMKQILKEYQWKKIIFIPNHARVITKMKELSFYVENKDRVSFLDISNEIKASTRTYAENFPDGTHSHFWIHELIAEKIIEAAEK